MQDGAILIGELARRAGVHRETLRYYERRGLLAPKRRTASGYRVYGAESHERLRFIKRAQAFGFSLDEISLLLGLRSRSPRSCRRVLSMLDEKLDDVAASLSEMKRFQKLIQGYRDRCARAIEKGTPCPVIEDVSQESRRKT